MKELLPFHRTYCVKDTLSEDPLVSLLKSGSNGKSIAWRLYTLNIAVLLKRSKDNVIKNGWIVFVANIETCAGSLNNGRDNNILFHGFIISPSKPENRNSCRLVNGKKFIIHTREKAEHPVQIFTKEDNAFNENLYSHWLLPLKTKENP